MTMQQPNLLSHPFRLDGMDRFVTHPDGSDTYFAERLALLVTTRPGERPMVPGYGISDPAYAGLDEVALRAQIDTYGPPVRLVRFTSRDISDTNREVTIEFDTTIDVEA